MRPAMLHRYGVSAQAFLNTNTRDVFESYDIGLSPSQRTYQQSC